MPKLTGTLSGVISTILAPFLFFMEDPSMNNVYSEMSSILVSSSISIGMVVSAINMPPLAL